MDGIAVEIAGLSAGPLHCGLDLRNDASDASWRSADGWAATERPQRSALFG